MIVLIALSAAGVLLFTLPGTLARWLGAALFFVCLASTPRGGRVGWALFGTSTILIGALVYGFTIPAVPSIHLGPWAFTPSSALLGAAEMLRVLGLFSLGLLASRWIPTDDLLPIVSRHRFPLYVTTSILRQVPALREDVQRIRRTQTSRGLTAGSMWRPSWLLPILVPVFVNALRRARDQALALELAGFGRRRP